MTGYIIQIRICLHAYMYAHIQHTDIQIHIQHTDIQIRIGFYLHICYVHACTHTRTYVSTHVYAMHLYMALSKAIHTLTRRLTFP